MADTLERDIDINVKGNVDTKIINEIKSIANEFIKLQSIIKDTESGKIAFDFFDYNYATQSIKSYEYELERLIGIAKELGVDLGNISSLDIMNADPDIRENAEAISELISEIREYGIVMSDINGASGNLFDIDTDTSEKIEDIGGSINDLDSEFQQSNNSADIFNMLIRSIGSSGNISASSLASMAKSAGGVGVALTVAIGAIKAYWDAINKATDEMKSLGIAAGDTALSGIEALGDGIVWLEGILRDSFDELREFSEIGAEIQSNYYTLFNYLDKNAAQGVLDYANSLNKLLGINANQYISNLSGILSVAKNITSETEEQIAVVTKLNNLVYDLYAKTGGAYGNTEAIKSQLESAINLNVLNSRSAVAKALDLTDTMIEEFKSLSSVTERYNWVLEKATGIQGLYTKWLQTESGQIELLKMQYQTFMDNIGTLALGLYAKIAPILNFLLELANSVLASLTSLFGINLENSAMANSASNYDSIAESIDNIGKSAEKNKKKLSSFDDVIQISGDSSNEINDLSKSFGEISTNNNWAGLFEGKESALKKFIDELKELLDAGEFQAAGKKIADALTDGLNSVPWDDIKKNAEGAAEGIGKFINAFIETPDLFKSFGNTAAQALNTVSGFTNGLLTTINFTQLGGDLVKAWDSFWYGLDKDELGTTAYNIFKSIMDLVSGWLQGDGLVSMTSALTGIIGGMFDNVTEDDIDQAVDNLIGIIDQIFQSLANITQYFKEHPEIKDKLLEAIKKFFEKLNENASEWGEIANEFINMVLDFLSEALASAEEGGLTDAIGTFLDKLNIAELANKFIALKIRLWWDTKVQVFFAKVKSFFNSIVSAWKQVADLMVALGTAAVVLLVKAFSGLWNTVKLVFTNIGDFIASVFQGLKDFFAGIFEWLGEKIEALLGWFQNIKLPDWLTDPVGAAKNKLSSAWDTVTGFVTGNKKTANTAGDIAGAGGALKIPKLARGGIVDMATIAMVGESGREAVIPLENNTEWIDKFATAIASKLNTGATNGNVTIDMSGITKSVYTRSEMLAMGEHYANALKVYGINVTLVR